ncbi:MAG: hypothetical protein ACOC44_02710 [Promethearchaeia archaeon]
MIVPLGNYISDLGYLPEYKSTEPVSPYTSRICGECLSKHGTQTRSLKNTKDYNRKRCKQCGREGDRHELELEEDVEAK